MTRIPVSLSALLLVILLYHAALAGAPGEDRQDAFPLLARALQAQTHQTFTGRQVIQFTAGKGQQWMRVVADVAREGHCSRLDYRFPASVADMVITDDGFHLRQFHPSCHLYLIRHSPPPDDAISDAMLSLLRRSYRCQGRGMSSANNRPCDLVSLTPRFGPGPSRLYWIDRATYAILRTEEFDATGQRQYISAFETIQFSSRLIGIVFAPAPPAGMSLKEVLPTPSNLSFASALTAAELDGRAPCWTPRGYRLLRCARLPRRSGAYALLLRYGDGLKTVCIYEEKVTPAFPPLAVQQRMLDDEIGRYGQQAWVQDQNDLRVTIVGDVTLPASLGQDIMHALDPGVEMLLSRALARDFGAAAKVQAEHLRHQGLGYDQIAARLIARKKAEEKETVDVDSQDQAAREWVSAAVRAAH